MVISLTFGLQGACSPADPREAVTAEVRDSAGIRIVENFAPAWPQSRGWRLSAAPILSVGTVEGAPEQMFSGVRGAYQLTDGRLIVGDAANHELRFFDPGGRFLQRVGQRGGGPGEFMDLTSVFVGPSDSIAVYDIQRRQVSFFSGDGVFVRTTTLEMPDGEGMPILVGWRQDGSLVVMRIPVYSPGDAQSGLRRPPVRFDFYDTMGTLRTTLGEFPGTEQHLSTEGDAVLVSTPLFARFPVLAHGGDRLVIGTNDAYELVFFEGAGDRPQHILRLRKEPRAVAETDVRLAHEERVSTIADAGLRRQVEASLSRIPAPRALPFYGSALFDAAGNLWVGDYRAPSDLRVLWRVFDAAGHWLGSVEMPAAFRPTQIGRDFVLGVLHDEWEVERLTIFALETP